MTRISTEDPCLVDKIRQRIPTKEGSGLSIPGQPGSSCEREEKVGNFIATEVRKNLLNGAIAQGLDFLVARYVNENVRTRALLGGLDAPGR